MMTLSNLLITTILFLEVQIIYDLSFMINGSNLLTDFKHEGDKNVNKEETLSKSVDGITVSDVTTTNNYEMHAVYCYSLFQFSTKAQLIFLIKTRKCE